MGRLGSVPLSPSDILLGVHPPILSPLLAPVLEACTPTLHLSHTLSSHGQRCQNCPRWPWWAAGIPAPSPGEARVQHRGQRLSACGRSHTGLCLPQPSAQAGAGGLRPPCKSRVRRSFMPLACRAERAAAAEGDRVSGSDCMNNQFPTNSPGFPLRGTKPNPSSGAIHGDSLLPLAAWGFQAGSRAGGGRLPTGRGTHICKPATQPPSCSPAPTQARTLAPSPARLSVPGARVRIAIP